MSESRVGMGFEDNRLKQAIAAKSVQAKADGDFHHEGRLQSLGLMAGVVAHDFNNLLVGILGNADLALALANDGHDVTGNLEQIIATAKRGAELVDELLCRSSDDQFPKDAVNVSAFVDELIWILAFRVPENVQLCRTIGPEVECVTANAVQLRQVLMNLILNAIDAIGSDKGRVFVSAACIPNECNTSKDGRIGRPIEAKGRVCIEVSDTGCGMDPDTLSKVFDPFFTTKRDGKGLGLAAVENIVRNHGGKLEFDSKPGEGTVATVTLPVA